MDPQQQEVSSTSTTPQLFRSKINTLVIIGSLVVLVLVGAVSYVLGAKSQKTTSFNTVVIPTITKTPSATLPKGYLINIYFKDNVSEQSANNFRKELESKDDKLFTRYISSEQAKNIYKELNKDAGDRINPVVENAKLPSALKVYKIDGNNLESLKSYISQHSLVDDYNIVEVSEENIKKTEDYLGPIMK